MSKTGVRIKNRRKELGLTADELAERLNVSRSTIFRYENGDIEKVPADFIKTIAQALSTTPDYLMGWDDSTFTIAAHLNTDDLTKAELEDVANYIDFIRNRRNN